MNVLQIAYECGFRSRSSLNRSFKESPGLTPGDYRQFKEMKKAK